MTVRYLLLSTGPVAMDGAPDIAGAWWRDQLIEAILEHLPEVYHRTRPVWSAS